MRGWSVRSPYNKDALYLFVFVLAVLALSEPQTVALVIRSLQGSE